MEPTLEHTPAGRAVPFDVAAIVIMATGFGWVGGNFATATDTLSVKLAITLLQVPHPQLRVIPLADLRWLEWR